MQAVEAGIGSFVQGIQNFLSKFNSTKGTCTLSQERFEDGSFYIHYSIIPTAIPPTRGGNLQHSAWCNSFRAVLCSEVDWGLRGQAAQEVLGCFSFFCLLSLQRKKGYLSNSRTFQYVAGYFNCKSNFNLRHVNISMYCFMPSMNLRKNLSVYICFTIGSSFVNKLTAIMVNSHLLSQNLD